MIPEEENIFFTLTTPDLLEALDKRMGKLGLDWEEKGTLPEVTAPFLTSDTCGLKSEYRHRHCRSAGFPVPSFQGNELMANRYSNWAPFTNLQVSMQLEWTINWVRLPALGTGDQRDRQAVEENT